MNCAREKRAACTEVPVRKNLMEEVPMKNTCKYLVLVLGALFALALASCGGSDSDSENTGKLSLSLADAPASEYQAVYVTVNEVQVHRFGDEEGPWETILTPGETFNLLELVNGHVAPLGVADLPTGTYTQMRLVLAEEDGDSSLNIFDEHHPYANYLIDSAGDYHELKVPSGYTSGLKLVHTFEVEAGRTVGLILDFDAGRSVVKAGNSGNWHLKPTIKIIDTLNLAMVTGSVTDQVEDTQLPIAGAAVSAQVYDPDTDEISVAASTITDEGGDYLLYLDPGTYNLVVTADGYATSCRKIEVDYDDDVTEDFILDNALSGAVTVNLTLPEIPVEAATVEFRQEWAFVPEEMILVKSVNYASTTVDVVTLPGGVSYYASALYDGMTRDAGGGIETGDTVVFNFLIE